MSSRRSVPEPMHQCAVAHHFTSSQPTFSRVALVGCGQSSTQIPPGRLMTTSAAMCAQVVLVTIPIGNRCCFTQRFSPTGFILNAPDSLTAIIATPYARIQDKTCTFSSILAPPCGHLITLSARASTFGGIVTPICLAALRLITSSNFVGCSTGRSAGFAPFRILST